MLSKERWKRQFEVTWRKDRSDRNKVDKKVKGIVETESFESLVGEVKELQQQIFQNLTIF